MLTILASLIVAARAAEIPVRTTNPLKFEQALAGPTSFEIENPRGDVTIEEGEGANLILEGDLEGHAATVKVAEAGPGVLRITVEYPDDGIHSDGDVNISGSGPIKIGNVNGRNVTISDIRAGGVHIDSVVIRGGGGSLHLRVKVPAALLANLRAAAPAGELTVSGAFDGAAAATRTADLSSGFKTLSCRRLRAMGGLGIETGGGAVMLVSAVTSRAVIKAKGGPIAVIALIGDAELHADGEILWVGDGLGGVKVEAGYEGVTLKGQGLGDVFVNARGGNIEIEGGRGRTEVHQGFGATVITKRADGPVVVRTSGKVTARKVVGELDIEGEYELLDVATEGSGLARIVAKGPVTFAGGEGELHVENGFEKVDVSSREKGPVTIDSRGEIEVRDSSGLLRATGLYKPIRVTGHRRGHIDATTSAADIHFDNPDPTVSEAGTSPKGKVRFTPNKPADCGLTFTK